MDYMFASVTSGFSGIESDEAHARFADMLSSPLRLMLWFTVFLGVTGLIVSTGLRNGIERATGILMPALFLMLLALTVYSAVAGDMAAGIRFLFAVDFGKINPKIMLLAVGHAFFSIGVSMGLMMAYGAYLPQNVSIPRTAVIIAGADTFVAIVAGLAIFPLVFANGLAPGEGPGLIFVTLPIAFGNMPAGSLFRHPVFSSFTVCSNHLFHRYHRTSRSPGGRTWQHKPQGKRGNSHWLRLVAGYRQRAVIQYLGRI